MFPINQPSPPAWSQDQYLTTMRFAAEAHTGQTITGTNLPYLLHISLVAMEIIAVIQANSAYDGMLAVDCAILHDVIEDTQVTYAEVAQRFGTSVANGVLALTKDTTLPKEQQMPDSLQRILRQPHEIWMVKLADRICNLQPPPAHWPKERVQRYRSEAELILTTLGAANAHLADRLHQKIASYGR